MNDFISGSISGLAQVAIGYPLNTFMTHLKWVIYGKDIYHVLYAQS